MSGKLSSFYKQGRPHEEARAEPKKERKPLQSVNQAQIPASRSSSSDDEEALRRFDLTYKFGPCIGITRLQRWERAAKFGLQPPQEVKDILERRGAESTANACLWSERV